MDMAATAEKAEETTESGCGKQGSVRCVRETLLSIEDGIHARKAKESALITLLFGK